MEAVQLSLFDAPDSLVLPEIPGYDYFVPSIYIQTGWWRPCVTAICQDPIVWGKITEFNFNFENEKFLAYHQSRVPHRLDKIENPELFRFLMTSPVAEDWLLNSSEYKYINSGWSSKNKRIEAGDVVPFGRERESVAHSLKMTKARFQDSWELFILAGEKSHKVPGINLNIKEFV